MSTGDGGPPCSCGSPTATKRTRASSPSCAERLPRARLDLDALFAANAALYGAENLASSGGPRWLCRVPKTLAEAKRVSVETPPEAFVQSRLHEGYQIAHTRSYYGGIEQRRLVVHSEELERAARQRLERSLAQRERGLDAKPKRLLPVRKVSFACRTDAQEAVEAFATEHLRGKHHRLALDPPPEIVEEAHHSKPGRPKEPSPKGCATVSQEGSKYDETGRL
jgi:transposase